ncbi:unnamed protein product [Rotaria socialis]|uniref:Uncharacterized protein n=1 Tax=Rotaria socialis TaxID=392032 RepID=A0A817XU98_9BILA|nr:unnamed protein product [Rotaria socialis]CAF3373628.1 unnamed protein product [Rotaria socialis]CAF3413635.1 unnamed protein product [Rotaria socialis]CAF3525045.1 unnamed protein product [Rotaria socialis]CAF3776030.1 unnamed protein product [Rotaria socialis]
MYYVPVTQSYASLPVTYVPVYSTTINRAANDLSEVKRELADLRGELSNLRLEKETCPICSSTSSITRTIHCDETCRLCAPTTQVIECDGTCSICYPRVPSRERIVTYSRSPSPVHYCSLCDDYVIDQAYPPPSPRPHKRIVKKVKQQDKLSEYLSRQLDLHRLQHRYIPEQRPVWIPTAYKHDYPHRRWVTRESRLAEP